MTIDKKLEKQNQRLSEINTALERDWRKLTRIINRMDKLQAEKKRILKPRALRPEEKACKVTGEEWHKIRNMVELDDPIPDFLKRNK